MPVHGTLNVDLKVEQANRVRKALVRAMQRHRGLLVVSVALLLGGFLSWYMNQRWEELSPNLAQALLQGFAESMSPGILGFTLLSLAGLICAVGLSRSAKLEG